MNFLNYKNHLNFQFYFLKFDQTKVQAIDRDIKVFPIAKQLEKQFPERFKFYQIKFSQLNTFTTVKNVITIKRF